MPTLDELIRDADALLNVLEQYEDELLSESLTVVVRDLMDKTDAIGYLNRKLRDEAASSHDLARQVTDRAKRLERQRKRLGKHVAFVLNERGKTSIAGDAFTLVRMPGRMSLEIDDALVPDRFRKVVPQVVIDREAIRNELESGGSIPGCRMVTGDDYLVVRA